MQVVSLLVVLLAAATSLAAAAPTPAVGADLQGAAAPASNAQAAGAQIALTRRARRTGGGMSDGGSRLWKGIARGRSPGPRIIADCNKGPC
ncbi:hypothetical protein DFJ73DRAFT_246256 [Zopfochytrium polystomum]|nr:hypothetical protein DFJ73DRAFT_246256 [Zopfochytrium polystomum]